MPQDRREKHITILPLDLTAKLIDTVIVRAAFTGAGVGVAGEEARDFFGHRGFFCYIEYLLDTATAGGWHVFPCCLVGVLVCGCVVLVLVDGRRLLLHQRVTEEEDMFVLCDEGTVCGCVVGVSG